MSKSIIIGKVREEFYNSPIQMFQTAVRLSKKDHFTVRTNNPQFIESFEVLCGEENVGIYFQTYHEPSKLIEITFKKAYDYLGDVYDIVNVVRFNIDLCGQQKWPPISDERILEEIKEYQKKWSEFE